MSDFPKRGDKVCWDTDIYGTDSEGRYFHVMSFGTVRCVLFGWARVGELNRKRIVSDNASYNKVSYWGGCWVRVNKLRGRSAPKG